MFVQVCARGIRRDTFGERSMPSVPRYEEFRYAVFNSGVYFYFDLCIGIRVSVLTRPGMLKSLENSRARATESDDPFFRSLRARDLER